MILEAAELQVKEGLEIQFEKDFAEASQYISAIKGYRGHTLQKCIEVKNKYLLLAKWDILEDHTVGFRESPEWKRILHNYYDPFPTVEHYETVFEN
ncbi:MAG: antibiotic biosynthesis monooxygenase [Flavobacteriales bacterium]|nr:antibiotic biosynthesis monooxygenase [Flavobacteriales bacterium]